MRTEKLTWLSRNLIALGVVSLFTDVASEMIIPLLPVFLTSTLGASALALGWIEGSADALSSVLKLASGRWADRLGRNRPLVICGYLIASAVRPLLGFARQSSDVLVIRILDRIGKGVRTSPRDAIIAASVDEEHRGSAFGFHRAMDHTGAILGPLIAVVLLSTRALELRTIFWLTAIPGAITMLVILFFVEEGGTPAKQSDGASRHFPSMPRSLVRLLVPVALFTIGNSSDTFLLLKAHDAGAPLEALPLLWAGLHVTKAGTSLVGGRVADRIGFVPAISIGWLIYAAIYCGFACVSGVLEVSALFIVYGLYHGLTEAPEKALVSTLSGEKSRGTAFGFYHLTVGLLALPASALFGFLWDSWGSRVAFFAGAAWAILALILLLILRPGSRVRTRRTFERAPRSA
jgi:MFS family permease